MSTLLVQIEDQTLPLAKCVWVHYRPCGCACSVMEADWGDDEVFATEDQAHRELTPLKRDRDREIRKGFTLKLVTFAYYRESVDITANCQLCKPAKAVAFDGR
ncbi:hypothetical protein ACIQV3_22395 [Streptomyces sp. NPDC099050]|uniref:hypothetical protein n=1 Tax=Streptomyces sp. NPDC099050 TaxID=3366100 RepID=UPI003819D79A